MESRYLCAKKLNMKRITLCLVLVATACIAHAQDVGDTENGKKEKAETEIQDSIKPTCRNEKADDLSADTLTLKEVVVKGERMRNTADALRLTPTARQKEASSDSYGLLARLALPVIKVDEVTQTISVPGNLGVAQVRINDIVATRQDLMALDVKTVRYVDFIENPGVRYGKDVSYVINIVTRKPEKGYSMGANLMNSATVAKGNNSLFARFNNKKSELGISYSAGYADMKRQRYEETAEYLMPDNSLDIIQRKDIASRQKSFNHDIQLKYCLTDTGRYMMQATLGGNITNSPDGMRRRMTVSNAGNETVSIGSSDRSLSPTIDLYFYRRIDKKQSITTNISGIYIKSDYSYVYSGSSPYSYTSEGRSYSLFGECIYENRLRPFTLSSGVQYNMKYVNNRYNGDSDALNGIHSSDVYAFTQIKGLLHKLNYTAGAGVNRRYYSQDRQHNEYLLFRPELALSYPLTKKLMMKYDISVAQHPPRFEYLGDVAIKTNEKEISVGNPYLRPARVVDQSFTLSYQQPSFYSQITTSYRQNLHCVMAQTERTTGTDGNTYFVFSRSNQNKINLFYVDNYTNWDILPDKLSLTVVGGLYRCFNYGNNYKHHSSAFNWGIRLSAYLGKLSLSANADNGWNFLEGETKVRQAKAYSLSAAYKLGNFGISLHWQHCFQNELKTYRGELLNRYVHKTQSIVSGDMGNMVSLNVSWRMSKGREYKQTKRNGVKKDTDTGIKKTTMDK